jgi:ABC-type antimicrobial peptide transport system permease subunit
VEEFLGYYPIQVTSDILDQISTLEMGILIVNLIFNLVKSLLIIISVLIIYSLLMVSVESKNFEIAVIRMVGLQRGGIIGLVICQSFLYVIPAIIFAFSLCIVCLSKASVHFEAEYKVKIDKLPSFESSLQAIFIGTVIPLLSSVLPIQTALKRSLVDSLDTQRSKTQGIYVNIL